MNAQHPGPLEPVGAPDAISCGALASSPFQ